MVHIPTIKSDVLDRFLAAGWYRMHGTVFTTNYVNEKDPTTRVYWLRYAVNNVRVSKHKELIKRNAAFTAIYRGLVITKEMNDLYAAYYDSIEHDCSANLQGILGAQAKSVFDSYVIEVRNGDKLIAAGIFDKGNDSIAGIVNFYHPDYKKYSLGKYLMLLKLQYCRDNKIGWYYPGYFGPELPKFSYKLFMDKTATEVFIPEVKKWIQFSSFPLPIAVKGC